MIAGAGFTLAPSHRDRLIEDCADNGVRIFPYLGGEDVNTSPSQTWSRYVIDFGNLPLEEAQKCDLLCANCHRELEEKLRLGEPEQGTF